MNDDQTNAWLAGAGGVSPELVAKLVYGALWGVFLLMSIWMMVSLYRGWAAGNVTKATGKWVMVRWAILASLVLFFFFS
ncbi:TIGR03758 family integrating conjugative element protein [Serratia fonticola]